MRRTLLAVTLVLLAVAPSSAEESPIEVGVGIVVVGFGNYDVNRGTYTLDFYMWFEWDPALAGPDFTPEKFEFMNGRATSKEKIFDETNPETGLREVWFRVQAGLYSEPRFADFPFDAQSVEVLLEDSVNTASRLRYVPIADRTGLDDGVRIAGWRVEDVRVTTSTKDYVFGESYDRLRFTIRIARETTSLAFKTFLPPAAFVLVSGLSFLFHPSKVAQRLTLGTSMLISAVMFHVSQTFSLPPVGQLVFFDKLMLSVYSFLAGSLVVTTIIAIDEDYWKDRDYTGPVNRYGAAATVALPGVVFGLLSIL